MGAEQPREWRQAVASALEWWRDAGVDTLVADAPRDWLAPPPRPAPAPRLGDAVAAPRVALPATLDEFMAWRMRELAPEASWPAPRIAPTGPVDAPLMVLVDMPERGDTTALMEGPEGRLLARMLAAIGLSRESVHLAAVAWARPLTGRIAAGAMAEFEILAHHHVSLVKPKKLLLLGETTGRAILGTDNSSQRHRLHAISHSAGITEAVASRHPRFLLERPAAKAEAWKHLLLLTGGNSL